ncbi:MAG: 5'/3'-nucleotidase SurE [Chlamydiota bacterium]
MQKIKIVLTNDDGIEAVGIQTLWEGLKCFADLAVVAPMKDQSGKGVGVTFDGPIRAEKETGFEETPAWKVEGTPADCVKLALGGLLDWKPDLIVSGINHGSNAGREIFHSGTAGGAIQSTLLNVPGIAFSHLSTRTETFPPIKPYLFPIIEQLVRNPLPVGTFLNVNFPEKTIRGVKMARQGVHFWYERPRKVERSEGDREFYLDRIPFVQDEHPESDISLLKAGWITAVPIHINEMTDHSYLQAHKERFATLFKQPLTSSSP